MFGERVREERVKKDLTQAQLAEMVRVSSPMITQIERGTKQASAPLIGELAKVLGCTADYLIYGDGLLKKESA